MERGTKRQKLSVPWEYTQPSLGTTHVPVYPEMVSGAPSLSHCCTTLGHREEPLEVVSTSPCGDETGLGTSKREPEGICRFSVPG